MNDDSIIKLYATNIVVIDDQPDEDIKVIKEKLEELQNQMRILKLLGVKFCKCDYCDMPFTSVAQKIKHENEFHLDM